MRILSRGETEIREWTEYVYSVDVPEEQWLRVQFNVCSPGSLWIDDFRVEPLWR